MKSIKFNLIGRCVIISAMLVILPGCYTTSLHPLFTEEDLVDDPNLIGEWRTNLNGEWGSSEGGKLIFEEMGTLKNRFYRWTMYDDKGKEHSNFVARLVNVQGYTFLDLSPIVSSGKFSTSDSLLISPHFFMLVRQIQPTLQIAYLDEKWLEKYLTENAEAPQHEKTNSGYVLTAPTEALQTFLLKCAATEGAFKPDLEFSRLPERDRETVINPFTDQSGDGSEVSESTVAAAANDSGKLTDAETKALAAIQAGFTPGVRYSRRLDIDWKALESAANKGNPEAMFHWGRIHDVEMGISADLEVSMRYYQMAADAGNSSAQISLGWAYLDGVGMRKDASEAFRLWRLSAMQGDPLGQYGTPPKKWTLQG